MKKYALVILTVFAFVATYFRIALPHGQPTIGYSIVPDAEIDFLVSLSVFEGGGLYSDFSIVYPPGRFLLQSGLFHLFTPSFMVLSVWHIAIALVFFPALLFITSFLFFQTIIKDKLKEKTTWLAYPMALGSSLVYLMFIRSAQEVHLISALFFSILFWPGKLSKTKSLVLGLLWGLVLLFRTDAGIILSLSLLPSLWLEFRNNHKKLIELGKFGLGGLLIVWIPILLAIVLRGSITNFLYDTLILGLTVQPKFMSLPIPDNEFFLVFWASLILLSSTAVALFTDSLKLKNQAHRLGIQIFSIFALLSYVSALGRSDEPHLWYGLIWLSPLAMYALYKITISLLSKEKIKPLTILGSGLFFLLFSLATLKLKNPSIFLLTTPFIILFLQKKSIQTYSLLIGGVITTVLTFHSLSYLKLKMFIPLPPAVREVPFDWITDEENELHGFLMQPESETLLKEIRADIPQEEKYLFVFPVNVFLTEYFNLKNPSRHVMLSLERTEHTEQQNIDSIVETQTKYFLAFKEEAQLRGGTLWRWIENNTEIVKTYSIPENEIQLRVLKSTETTP